MHPAASTALRFGVTYVSLGHGVPLVVLPGLTRSNALDEASTKTSFHKLATITQRTLYVVGRPCGLQRGLSMHELAAMQAAALQDLFTEPVDILGISTGGSIALQLAVDHPQIVKRLIIAAAASTLGVSGSTLLRAYGQQVEQGQSGAALLARVLAPPSMRWLMALGLWITDKREKHINPTDMLATIDAETDFDITSDLPNIQAPTLVIGGSHDQAYPVELFQTTAEHIPNSQLHIYQKRGHMGTLWDPAFGRDVTQFLNLSFSF